MAQGITEALERFTPEEWLEKHTAVSDEDFAKDPGRNRLAVVLSRTNHMSYHLGQIMLARRRLSGVNYYFPSTTIRFPEGCS